MKHPLTLLLIFACLCSAYSQEGKQKWILGSVQTHLGFSFDVYANYKQQQMLNQVVSPELINYQMDKGEVSFVGHNPVESATMGISFSLYPVDPDTKMLNERKEMRFSLFLAEREGLISYYENFNTPLGSVYNDFTYCIMQTELAAGMSFLFHNSPDKSVDAYIGMGGQLGATVYNDMLMMVYTQEFVDNEIRSTNNDFIIDGHFNVYQRFMGIAGVTFPLLNVGVFRTGLNLETQLGSGINWVSGGSANWLPATGSILAGLRFSFF